MPQFDYDLFVIGGGSGGVRAARLVSALNRRVAIAEEFRFGGTCVIRGCVPKKLLLYASQFPDHFADAVGYGWTLPESSFDWSTLIARKDKEIARLSTVYEAGVEKAGGEIFHSRASLVDAHTVYLEDEKRTVTAENILIATGGRPNPHAALLGSELCILSDKAFDLPKLPKAIAIAGSGYIAVELANIFHGLGVCTTLVFRGLELLQHFDADLRRGLHEEMAAKGIRMHCQTVFESIDKRSDGRIRAHMNTGDCLVVDQVLLALGRIPNTENLGLEAAGVNTGKKGEIIVDEFSRTNISNIWAIGDVTDRIQLTPVAIHEAICFVETVFGNKPTSPDYGCIATAVFSQPEVGTVGLSEDEAAKRFSELDIFATKFRPMHQALSGRQQRMMIKLVVNADTRQVLGAHILGPHAAEKVQLLGISVKAGLTIEEFYRTMAVHPTAMEEVVTMYSPTYRIKDGVRIPH